MVHIFSLYFVFLPYFYNTKIVTVFSNSWQIWELIAQNLLEIVPKIRNNLVEKIHNLDFLKEMKVLNELYFGLA